MVKVMTEMQAGAQPWLAIEAETPEGKPDTESVTAWLDPAMRDLVMVFWV